MLGISVDIRTSYLQLDFYAADITLAMMKIPLKSDISAKNIARIPGEMLDFILGIIAQGIAKFEILGMELYMHTKIQYSVFLPEVEPQTYPEPAV